MERLKKIMIEAILIILISLFVSFIYNTVSPTGLRVLPKKVDVK